MLYGSNPVDVRVIDHPLATARLAVLRDECTGLLCSRRLCVD